MIDLLVVGGGIHGTGIARDAAGRGLSVVLVEQDDLASGTSSASSKLIHGGLRYLEHGAFGLVRESLREREILLAAAPHLVRPLRFVLPHAPWQRPAWVLRTGLFLYDHLAGRRRLETSRAVALDGPLGDGLREDLSRGFTYADCWTDDARLVLANALDAAARGATVLTRTACTGARRMRDAWEVTLRAVGDERGEHGRDAGERGAAEGGVPAGVAGGERVLAARVLVNAAGPWAARVLDAAQPGARAPLRLVKGSHLVVPRVHEQEHALILQHEDRRVVFVIPFERRFSLIGTTDVPLADDALPAPGTPPRVDDAEIEYLCGAVGRFLASPPAPADVVTTFAGIRPLFDDGRTDPSRITRDARLELDAPPGAAPMLSVIGGKLTSYRLLSERVLERLRPFLAAMGDAWTHDAVLPGGERGGAAHPYAEDRSAVAAVRASDAAPAGPSHGRDALDAVTPRASDAIPASWLDVAARRYGARTALVLDGATTGAELGELFVADDGAVVLCEREIAYLVAHEWARTADDVLLRRTKAGLHLDAAGRAAVAACIEGVRQAAGV